MIDWFGASLLAFCVALASITGVVIYRDSVAEKIELTKSDWRCTRTELLTVMIPQTTGKTTILMPMVSSVCVTYERLK